MIDIIRRSSEIRKQLYPGRPTSGTITVQPIRPRPETASLTRTLTGGVTRQLGRPTAIIPSRPSLLMPTARGGGAATKSLTRPAGDVTLLVPTARGATPLRGDITTGGMTTGGLGSTLAGIEGELRGAAGGIMSTAKGFMPTAIKIVAAIVILKIVFWLIRRRR